ncbi:glycoside hydrolase family 43 protein [Sphingomonas montana]|uniref:glycoside hydrolase family 43 protein n=1 Tax=Sphingomonas montana TaxID=1843236 RepID=UPI001F0ABEA9|nr:glycoside hydrolase family 43 protein [Sphingomonas montana]
MTDRRSALALLIGGAALAAARRVSAPADATLLFAYFSGVRGDPAGLRLARSTDGLRFDPVLGGRVLLSPTVGESRLLRDPFLTPGPRSGDPWHLLWTTGWTGVTLGHATSHDLIHWSPQRAIPVMATIPGTRNVWAPEMIWDARAGHFMLFWSSTVTGRFPETAGTSEDAYNHRLWYATTRDFVTISPPELLWDPGFSVIDATFTTDRAGGLHLIVKDETLTPERKHLRIARAASPTGPFGALSPAFTPAWVEGPTAIRTGGWTYVYYDRYRDGGWGAARSRDLVTWQDVSDRIVMPRSARHGTVVHAPAGALADLR